MSARLLAACVPFLLAGCISLDPHYDRPTSPVSGQLPAGEAYASLKGTQGNNYRDIDWQQYILDDRLRQVVAMALDSSRDLREAVASVKSARAQYGEERSNLFPTINAELTGTRSRSLNNTGSGTSVSSSYEGDASTARLSWICLAKTRA